ncbi:MAG TPA: TIGR03067 domain-containing protein [Vicinamibacterales bacterium]|jgi:uncharacterized protein (TIGR03067 family)
MTHIGSIVAALVLVTGLVTQGTNKTTKAAGLQGTWTVTSLNGQSATEGSPELTLTFTGDKYQQAVGGKVNERGTFKVDGSKKPMTIDFAITEGDDAGKTQLGIVEVSGDTVRMAAGAPAAAQRPTDFAVKDGALVVVGKRRASSD